MAIRLPSAMHVPTVAVQPDPGVQTSGAAFGVELGAAIQDAGQDVSRTAQAFGDVARQEQSRNAAKYKSRNWIQRNREGQEEYDRIITEDDITDPAVVDTFWQFEQQRNQAVIDNFDGSEDDRVDLELMLSDLSHRRLAALTREHETAAVAAVETMIHEQAEPYIMMAYRDPTKVGHALSEVGNVTRRGAGMLPSMQEAQLDAILRNKIGEAAIDGLLDKGNPGGAQVALDAAAADGVITADTFMEKQRQITNMQAAFDEAAQKGMGGHELTTKARELLEMEARGITLTPEETKAFYLGGPLVQVNTGDAAVNPFQDMGVKQLEGASEKMQSALAIVPELQTMRQAIETGAYQPGFGPNIGVSSPWGTIGVDVKAAIVPALQVATALGIADPQRLEQTELFSAIQARLTPLLRPVGSGAASDKDMNLFSQAIPNLSRSKEGNLKIIEFYEKAMQHNIREMQIAEQMIQDGTYSPSAYAQAVIAAGLSKVWTEQERELLTRGIEEEEEPEEEQKPAPSSRPSRPDFPGLGAP